MTAPREEFEAVLEEAFWPGDPHGKALRALYAAQLDAATALRVTAAAAVINESLACQREKELRAELVSTLTKWNENIAKCIALEAELAAARERAENAEARIERFAEGHANMERDLVRVLNERDEWKQRAEAAHLHYPFGWSPECLVCRRERAAYGEADQTCCEVLTAERDAARAAVEAALDDIGSAAGHGDSKAELVARRALLALIFPEQP